MNKKEFVQIIDGKLKLIRNEMDFTQDKMADVIGLSKKTLVQIEKGRSSLGWMGAVTVCSIFRDSEILEMTFGGDAQDLIMSLAFENYERGNIPTMGGHIWWKDIKTKGDYKVQQNIITNHYRILDKDNRRITFSFDYEYIIKRLNELNGVK